jgi:hypothetical protein
MAEVETSEPPTMPSFQDDEPSPSSQPASPPDVSSTAVATRETTLIDPSSPPQKKTKMIRRKRRPARPQVDASTLKSELPPQTGTIFNIWYNKWSGGDREDKYLSKTHAPSRCDISKDSGYTRADKEPGSYFCLFFARGICPKGHECAYLHRLPGLHDMFNPNIDAFGRDKHSDYRDDMGGVGSFLRQNRTLYVGRIHVTDDIEEVVARHFAEWGQIERTRVLNSRGVAFVTYTNEANAQFAKEAMAHQSLDHAEILNVRWATVDPNPLAQKREAHRIEEQAAEAVRRALPEEFVAEIEGRDPEARKRKKIEGSFGLSGYEAPDEVWFAKSRGQVEASQAPKMIEGDPNAHYVIHDEEGADAGDGDGGGGGGLLSSETLKALKGYKAVNGNGGAAPTNGAGMSAPLVGYGSDDDSD